MTKEQLQWAMYEAYATQLLNRIEAQEAEIATLRKQADGALCVGETLAKERDGLLTQVQDMRAERERLRSENQIMRNDAEDGYAEAIKVLGDPIALSKERDALRAEVAALQKRLRASIARGDFAQMEVAALMSQTPKQHPVAVGEWVKRTQSGMWSIGTTGKVAVVLEGAGCYELTSGETWDWRACEPCDPPATHDTPEGRSVAEAAVKREPKPGDVVRLVRVPTPDEYPHDTGRWEPNWGGIGDYMRVHHVGNNISGTRIVRAVFGLEWPISCVEIVSDEPDEIKVGDLVEVYQDRLIGRVIGVTTSDDNSFIVTIENNGMETVALADVRKVTT